MIVPKRRQEITATGCVITRGEQFSSSSERKPEITSGMEFGCDIPYLIVKGVPIHYMKSYREFEDIAPLINLGTIRTTVVSHMPSPRYCLGRSFSFSGWS